jgi:RHS repeat-associated protein
VRHDNFGRGSFHVCVQAGQTLGNGLATTAAYDQDYRLTNLDLRDGATYLLARVYGYGDGLNLTAIQDNVTAANNVTLNYSPANRLQNANGPWGNSTYWYDAVGNRTDDINSVGAVTTTRLQAYGTTNNRILTMTENGAAWRSYSYDGAGNITGETRPGETFVYTYNKRNRLASVTRNAAAWATYVYSASEQLASRVSTAPAAPLGTIHYIYDTDGHLIAEADGATGAVTRDYVWLPANDNGNDSSAEDLRLNGANDNNPPDLPLAVIDAVNTATPVTSHIHTDHLGRPVRMTNAAKATVWQATWKPWGEPLSIIGTATNNLHFPGQYFQIETGLHYNHHRQYDPVTGRYTQPDPPGYYGDTSLIFELL